MQTNMLVTVNKYLMVVNNDGVLYDLKMGQHHFYGQIEDLEIYFDENENGYMNLCIDSLMTVLNFDGIFNIETFENDFRMPGYVFNGDEFTLKIEPVGIYDKEDFEFEED